MRKCIGHAIRRRIAIGDALTACVLRGLVHRVAVSYCDFLGENIWSDCMAIRPLSSTPEVNYYSYPLGSIVAVDRGLYHHVGILAPHAVWGLSVIGFDQAGVTERPVWEFAQGKPFASCTYPSDFAWEMVVWRARTAQPNGRYHWRTFNCDYFVRYCHGLKMESPQANAAVAVGLLVCGGLAFAAMNA